MGARGMRTRSALGIWLLVTLTIVGSAHSDGTRTNAFVICPNQTYALCAVASCFVFADVAYCACDVESGDSITATYAFDNGENACSVNAQGAGNGFMVSTYSLPDSIVAPSGTQALYTCPAQSSNGAYAQC